MHVSLTLAVALLAAPPGPPALPAAQLSTSVTSPSVDPVGAAPNELAGNLLRAVEAGDTARVTSLLARGADPNQMGKFRVGVLARACERGDLATARALLAAGASVAGTSSWGETPLFGAVRSGRVELVELLLVAGADPQVRAKHGLRPLLLAAGLGNLAMVDRLLAAGAEVDVANADGATPLHLAAGTGCLPVVARLLERGAAPETLDRAGQDARRVALAAGHTDLAARLEKALRARGLPVLEPAPPPTNWAHAGDVRWEDFDYRLAGCIARVRGGHSEGGPGPCKVEATEVLLGDLSGDGEAEATVALHLRPAAERTGVLVLVYSLVEGKPVLLALLPAAGAPAPELRELRLDKGELVVDLGTASAPRAQRLRIEGGVLQPSTAAPAP